jgi:hypothetical protein
MTSSKNWAPEWRTTHTPEKVGSKDAFCAEFQHVESKHTHIYIRTADLKDFCKSRQKLDEFFVEQVLRAVLGCYVIEKGMPPKFIEAREVQQLRILKGLFRGKLSE